MNRKKEMFLIVEDPELLVVSRYLKKMMQRLLDRRVTISRKKNQEKAMILSLDLNQAPQSGKIRYENEIEVSAATKEDILATSTQALIRWFFDQLPVGTTVVSYAQKERIFMLDMGRKFFSKQSIFNLIDAMSLAQFNYLQLHFSENEGFRIESEIAPEGVSEEFLKKDEIREIIDYAAMAGIEIIPDLDSPGHLKQLLQEHPKWQLQIKDSRGKLTSDPCALNICNEEAVQFILSLYKEYMALFSSSKYFHIGGDEFVNFDKIDNYPKLTTYAKEHFGSQAEAIDTYVNFVNQIIEEMNSWGFIPRIWNDGFFRLDRKEVVLLSKNVEITYWTKWHPMMAPVSTFIKKGYKVINFNDNYFYYVLGENAGYTYPTFEKIMNEWEPNMFAQQQIVSLNKESFPGVAFSVWSDLPESQTQDEVIENVSLNLLAMMQKIMTDSFLTKKQAQQLLQTYKEG